MLRRSTTVAPNPMLSFLSQRVTTEKHALGKTLSLLKPVLSPADGQVHGRPQVIQLAVASLKKSNTLRSVDWRTLTQITSVLKPSYIVPETSCQ